MWVKLLMDEALRVTWPEGKSHAEPQRLIWSGVLRVEFCRMWVKLLMDEALRVAEPQRLIWSGGLRVEDA